MAGASPTSLLPSLRSFAQADHEAALSLIEDLTAAPPWPLAGAAAEALGEVRLPAAAHLALALASGERPREVRRGARRALHRLKQAGIHAESAPRSEPVVEEVSPPAIGPAFLSSCDPAGARLIWLALEVPGSGRSAANGVVYDSGRLESFTITRQSRAEFDQEVARARSDMEASGAFLVTEVPVPYALDLLTDTAQAAIAQQRGVPTDYAVYARYLTGPEEPPPSPVYDYLRATDVRFRPDLLDGSPEVLGESEMRGWYLPEDAVGPATAVFRERETSTLTLPPEAERDRLQAALRQIVTSEFGGERASRWRRRLEEMAYHFIRRDRRRPAQLALAAALALEEEGPPPDDHPWVLRLVQQSVARVLGLDPTEFQRQQGALAGLWTPGAETANVPAMPGHEARPSGLIIPRS
ncbi:MAG: hypothetical protein CL878_06935 [Dehalococcoidia bacterium]|nr:hypothetical protein [Dehalococcoidia bacterium]